MPSNKVAKICHGTVARCPTFPGAPHSRDFNFREYPTSIDQTEVMIYINNDWKHFYHVIYCVEDSYLNSKWVFEFDSSEDEQVL